MTTRLKISLVAILGLIVIQGNPFAFRNGLGFKGSNSDLVHAETPPTTQSTTLPAPASEELIEEAAGIEPEEVTKFLELVDANDLAKVKEQLKKTPAFALTHDPKVGSTPLHHATSVAMAQLLLDHQADLMALDAIWHAPPIRWAAGNQYLEVAKFLRSKGASQDDFLFAVAIGDSERVKTLLQEDPTLLQKPSEQNDVLAGPLTPLHIAARTRQPETAKTLLEAGADVNARMGWANAEPLETSAWAGAPEVTAVLLDHGADINALEEKNHHTALWYAAVTGRKKVVEILLKHGAKIEEGLVKEVEKSKQTPYPSMNLPPQADYDEVIKLLQKAGGK